MRRPSVLRSCTVALTLVAMLAAACAQPDRVGESSPSVISTTATSTTASAAPSSTSTSSTPPTTTSSSAPVDRWPETWLGMYRRDFPGYSVEFVEVTTGERIVLPVDRFRPYPGNMFGDGAGGLLIGEPPGHLAAGERHPVAFGHEDAWLQAVADVDGTPTAFSVLVEGYSGWEDLEIVTDVDITLIAHPLGQDPITVLGTHVSSRIDYPTGSGEQEGGWLQRVAYGGGILGIVWTRLGNCAWLELRAGLTDQPATVANPWPDEQCEKPYGGLLDVVLTADGRFLVGQVFPSVEPSLGGPDLVLWDLATGDEIDRLPGVVSFIHDGDRGLAVDRRTGGTDIEVALVRITDTGFEATSRPDLEGGGVGLIAGPLFIAAGATLAPAAPWTDCSAAGAPQLTAQPELSTAAAVTRSAIVEAIRDCDLEALAEVAVGSPGFRMADGNTTCDEPWPMSVEDDDPVGYWYRGDVDFDELRVMLDALAQPFTTQQDRYIWTNEDGYRVEIGFDGAWLLDWRHFPQPPCEGMECSC